MMKKDTNTMINLDVKGYLAKLIASENITIQHNKVKTASFDVKNRILTLPIFKEKSGDVYDMLIAHECAHALWTPYKQWEEICEDDELRAYVNVLEDTRIDKLIQAKYPGVVRNYENGFDILDKKNFFGLIGKDINKSLMLIDKINLRSKSLNRLPFIFAPEDKKWLAMVDNIETFDDVVSLAKQMLNWQKKQVEQMKKLPDFDNHIIAKTYDLGEDDEDDFDDEDSDNGQGSGSDAEENDDADEEKNDFNNFGDQKADTQSDTNKSGESKSSNTNDDDKEDSKGEADTYAKGAGGDDVGKKLLKVVTQDSFDEKIEQLLDKEIKGYIYGSIPKPRLTGEDSGLTSYKEFIKTFDEFKAKETYADVPKYDAWLQNKYKEFLRENKKTVSYLVKEFEMKKAATAYKRASTDKTGVIDPLKLKNYKFSDDIFKRLTILPDGKNHGLMMLLDWSGSMSDCLSHTVHQLINLVEFVRRVQIPFEVYFFTSERKNYSVWDGKKYNKCFEYKTGDWLFEDFNLVNCASHRMTKKELDKAMFYMFHMADYYDDRYGPYRRDYDYRMTKPNSYSIPNEFNLGNTPLNEALIYFNTLIPQFKKKYGIEKMTLITLTDGGANGMSHTQFGVPKDENYYEKKSVFKIDGKTITSSNSYTRDLTTMLLDHMKAKCDLSVIGFYILKRVRKWDLERYVEANNYYEREKGYMKLRKEMTKDKACVVPHEGYDKYFLLNGKSMDVENFDMSKETIKKGTTSELKRIFGKSMKNRLVSRVVLNKFIQEVA